MTYVSPHTIRALMSWVLRGRSARSSKSNAGEFVLDYPARVYLVIGTFELLAFGLFGWEAIDVLQRHDLGTIALIWGIGACFWLLGGYYFVEMFLTAITVGPNGITRRRPWGTLCLPWNEMERVDYRPNFNDYRFRGRHGTVTVNLMRSGLLTLIEIAGPQLEHHPTARLPDTLRTRASGNVETW